MVHGGLIMPCLHEIRLSPAFIGPPHLEPCTSSRHPLTLQHIEGLVFSENLPTPPSSRFTGSPAGPRAHRRWSSLSKTFLATDETDGARQKRAYHKVMKVATHYTRHSKPPLMGRNGIQERGFGEMAWESDALADW